MKVKCVSRHAEDVGGRSLVPGEVGDVPGDDPVAQRLIEEGKLLVIDPPAEEEDSDKNHPDPDVLPEGEPVSTEPVEPAAKPAAKSSGRSATKGTSKGGGQA
jgi:hypothetical protein